MEICSSPYVERRSAAGLISDFSARIVKGGVIGATETWP
jgi:hypothetical protein